MRRRRTSLRYIRWASKLAFLILFTIPIVYVGNGHFGGLSWPDPHTSITSALIRPPQPFFSLPLGESPCSIWLQGWSNPTAGAWIVEPLGALQALITSKVSLWSYTLIALGIVLAIIVLLGAMFCSWACPIGTVVDSFDTFIGKYFPKIEANRDKAYQQRQLDNQQQEINKANGTCSLCPVTRLVTKNGVAATGILAGSLAASSILGFNAFCLVCPIGIASRGLFHLKATTFATKALGSKAVNAMNYAGPFYVELLIFPVIAVLVSLKERRFWCNKLCPVGAIINLTSSLNPFIKPKVNQQKCIMNGCPEKCEDNKIGYCTACRKEDDRKCMKVCPAQINFLGNGSLHNCTKCMECYIACDHNAIEVKLVGKPDIFRVPGYFRNLSRNFKARRQKNKTPKPAIPA